LSIGKKKINQKGKKRRGSIAKPSDIHGRSTSPRPKKLQLRVKELQDERKRTRGGAPG